MAGGVKVFKSPERQKRLDGLKVGCARGSFGIAAMRMVRQRLLGENSVAVSRPTLQRTVQPYRQALKADALATTRFETPLGR